MRVVFDLTEDADVSAPFALPDGAILSEDDEIVLRIREVEIRLGYPQLLSLQSAINRFVFHGLRGEQDLNQDELPDLEHEQLRLLIRQMIDHGKIGVTDLTQSQVDELRMELATSKVRPEKWRTMQQQLLDKEGEIERLKSDLQDARAERRIRKKKETTS